MGESYKDSYGFWKDRQAEATFMRTIGETNLSVRKFTDSELDDVFQCVDVDVYEPSTQANIDGGVIYTRVQEERRLGHKSRNRVRGMLLKTRDPIRAMAKFEEDYTVLPRAVKGTKDTLRAMDSVWSRLPEEIIARVMSHLPVPALCTCRCVCKTWNELLHKPEFLDFCDLNGRKDAYLFVTLETNHPTQYGWRSVDDAYRRTTCFLDLEDRRWYSIPADASLLAPTDENVPRLLALDDGLICELSALSSKEHKLVMFDPVAKTRWKLPASTANDDPVFCGHNGKLVPVIVTAVDNADRSFKVFLMNRLESYIKPHVDRYFVYELSTHAWRRLPNPWETLGVKVAASLPEYINDSAVFFQGNLYVTIREYTGTTSTLLLLSFNLEENLWREVHGFVCRSPGYPQLIVTCNRMFMAMWSDGEIGSIPMYVSPEDGSWHSPSDFCVFEIREILVNENSSRSVVQIPNADLQESFGALPAHPFIHLPEQAALKPARKESDSEEEFEDEEDLPTFHPKVMKLSLRNILSGGPVTSESQT